MYIQQVMNFWNNLKSYFGFRKYDANIAKPENSLDVLDEAFVEEPSDKETTDNIDVVMEQPVDKNDNVKQQIFGILEDDTAAKEAPDFVLGKNVEEDPMFKGPTRWGCSWCCTDLNRPWPPMWAPHLQSQDDEHIGDSDEELDLQMIALTRPDADLKDKDEKSSLFTDIWRCFTTVREF